MPISLFHLLFTVVVKFLWELDPLCVTNEFYYNSTRSFSYCQRHFKISYISPSIQVVNLTLLLSALGKSIYSVERMWGQFLCNSCWISLGWHIPGTCGCVSQMYMGKYKPGSEVKRIYTMQAQECLEAQQLASGREMWAKKESHLLTYIIPWFVSPNYGKFSWYMCVTVTLLGLDRLVVSQGWQWPQYPSVPLSTYD